MSNLNRIIFKKDREHIDNLLQDTIKCSLCSNVLVDPYDCLCCNETFCFTCISHYISNYKTCPYDKSSIHDEFSSLSRLKPTTRNITRMLDTFCFNCINHSAGCNEEIPYADLSTHEAECSYTNKLKSTRKISVMTFNNKTMDNFDSPNKRNLEGGDKIDKIYDMLLNIQTVIINKNNSSIGKDCETPNFSLNNSKCEPNEGNNYSSENKLSKTNKLLLENLNDKLNAFENALEKNFTANERILKKLGEDIVSKFSEKFETINQNFTGTSTNNSSTVNSVSNSIRLNKEANKEVVTPLKKIKIDKRLQEEGKILGKSTSSKNVLTKMGSVSPRGTKSNLSSDEKKGKLTVKEKPFLLNSLEILEKLDNLEKSCIYSYINQMNSLKSFLMEECLPEIKNSNLDLALDTTNLFVQKIDEVLLKIK